MNKTYLENINNTNKIMLLYIGDTTNNTTYFSQTIKCFTNITNDDICYIECFQAGVCGLALIKPLKSLYKLYIL